MMVAGPIAVSEPGHVHGHVFARSDRNTLSHWWRGSDGVVYFADWGGSIVGAPEVLVRGDEQLVFARGADGTLSGWSWSAAKGLRFTSWGGKIESDPRAHVERDRLHVRAWSARSTVAHWWWVPGEGAFYED
ncbi:hypothetical protein Lesp02_34920 [Lentzea sp. NBRC 105346]|nr:hypothetical protein Lesp02_34920 [Lentzea sp. NBRC 105346]